MELICHYESTELAEDSDTVAFSTKEVYKVNLKNWIEPKWGHLLLGELEELPGVYVEQWLKTVKLATGTKAKIRNILSALCSHALRYGWMKNHPIKGKVRQSAKTTRVQSVLDMQELHALYKELEPIYRVMLLLDVPSGMRRGELLAAQWLDIDVVKKTIAIHTECLAPTPRTGEDRGERAWDALGRCHDGGPAGMAFADEVRQGRRLGVRVIAHEGQATALARGRDEEPHPACSRARRDHEARDLAYLPAHVLHASYGKRGGCQDRAVAPASRESQHHLGYLHPRHRPEKAFGAVEGCTDGVA
jgi:hypothetical protein